MNNVKQNDIMDLLIRTKNENKRMTGEKKAFNQLAAQAFVFFQAGKILNFSSWNANSSKIILLPLRYCFLDTQLQYN